MAPPAPVPNGSAVVLASARPVSYGGNVIAYGINSVVLAGTMLTIVTGPTSRSVNVGYPFASDGRLARVTPPGPLPLLVVSKPVPIGYMVAVTVIVPGVVTAAVVDSDNEY